MVSPAAKPLKPNITGLPTTSASEEVNFIARNNPRTGSISVETRIPGDRNILLISINNDLFNITKGQAKIPNDLQIKIYFNNDTSQTVTSSHLSFPRTSEQNLRYQSFKLPKGATGILKVEVSRSGFGKITSK